jgi:uncharacterized protein (TIGR03067 family)
MRMILKRALGFTALSLLMPCLHISAQQAAGAANQPTNVALERLQGTWQGVLVGQESTGKITITISSNSFHFHRDTNFWFETTITLPPGTDPQQLHATIKGSAAPQGDAIGKVVVAILKIEDGKLTLATRGGGTEETPTSFDDEKVSRYELRKVQLLKKNIELLKPK